MNERPGGSIVRELVLDRLPDAVPTVLVFRNGARAGTVTLSGVSTSYDVEHEVNEDWDPADFVQIVADCYFGGIRYRSQVFAGQLGGLIRDGDELTAALILDRVPDTTPTAVVRSDGGGDGDTSATVTAGFDGTEWVVTAEAIDGSSGRVVCLTTAEFGGISYSETLWASNVRPTLPPAFSGTFQYPSRFLVAPRPIPPVRSAGIVQEKDGSELYIAMDITSLLETQSGRFTATGAEFISNGAATVSDPATNPDGYVAGYRTGTLVGAKFTDLAIGSHLVTLNVLLEDTLGNSLLREIEFGLEVQA